MMVHTMCTLLTLPAEIFDSVTSRCDDKSLQQLSLTSRAARITVHQHFARRAIRRYNQAALIVALNHRCSSTVLQDLLTRTTDIRILSLALLVTASRNHPLFFPILGQSLDLTSLPDLSDKTGYTHRRHLLEEGYGSGLPKRVWTWYERDTPPFPAWYPPEVLDARSIEHSFHTLLQEAEKHQDTLGLLALRLSLHNGNLTAASSLLHLGVGLNDARQLVSNLTHIEFRYMHHYTEFVPFLRAHNIDIYTRDPNDRTLLHTYTLTYRDVVFTNHGSFLRNLLDHGFDVNSVDDAGNTPLMLSQLGDVNTKCTMFYCKHSKRAEIARTLILRGANTHTRNLTGTTFATMVANIDCPCHTLRKTVIAALAESAHKAFGSDNSNPTFWQRWLSFLPLW